MFSTDKPISDFGEDILNREMFSKQLAQAILSYSDTDNFNISLCGKWGCGKTSIINMVIEEIELKSKNIAKDKKPIIIMFNPWNYSDRNQLISQFFQTVLTNLNADKNSDKLKKVGDALQKYSSVFEYTSYIPVVGKYLEPIKAIMSGFGEQISDIVKENENLANQKELVIKALEEQDQKLIVVIDDIDRLNNEQIRLIFQLVNSLAGFPNMIYLLSFDKSVVVRALESEQNCNGEEYLEKIIQVPFDVPTAKLSSIHKLFLDKITKIFDEIPYDNFEENYWSSIFNNCISPFINSIRDVNRIVNVFRFKYGLMHNETNCIDLLAITTLQVCSPSIYEWIVEHINILSGSISSAGGITGIEQKKSYDDYISRFESIYPEDPKKMMEALRVLFPRFSWRTGGYTRSNDSEDELRYKQKISCDKRSEFYFTLSLEDITISKSQILSSITELDNESLDKYFLELIRKNNLNEYLSELKSYIKDIPDDRRKLFFDKMIWLQTLSINWESKGLLEPIPAYSCDECSRKILELFDENNRSNILMYSVNTADFESLPIITNMVYDIERSYGRIGDYPDNKYRLITEEKLSDIEKCLLKRLNDISKSNNLLDSKGFSTIRFIWNYLDVISFEEYLKEKLQCSQNIPKFLLLIAITWSGGHTHGWDFKEEYFSEFISKDKAYEKIFSLKGTDEFYRLDIRFKEIAIAYYLWFNSDDKDRHEISKENVDKLMPEWDNDKRI